MDSESGRTIPAWTLTRPGLMRGRGRYLLFAGDKYYPEGGWKDYRGAFGTLEDAEAAAFAGAPEWGHCGFPWAHVVNTVTGHVTVVPVEGV